MSKLLGKSLNRELLLYLRGDRSKGKVILLATRDSMGWPHVAMLSAWEVYARDRTNIRIATYDSSRTTQNLLRDGKLTLLLIDGGLACYVKGRATLLRRHAESDGTNSIFNVRVRQVLEDQLSGARVTSGIRYRKEKGTEPHEALLGELMRG